MRPDDAGVRKCVEQRVEEPQMLGTLDDQARRLIGSDRPQLRAVSPVDLVHVGMLEQVVPPVPQSVDEVDAERPKRVEKPSESIFMMRLKKFRGSLW